jgi:hypothetical protein
MKEDYMSLELRAKIELEARVRQRATAVLNAGLLKSKSPREVSAILTAVSPRISGIAASYPEFAWDLLDRICQRALEDYPDTEEIEAYAGERELNEMLLAAGSYEPMVAMKRYRRLYDVALFCQDLLSDFRSSAMILNSYKPRDAVSEVVLCIAAYFAEEMIRHSLTIPSQVSAVLGDEVIEIFRQRQVGLDKVSPEVFTWLEPEIQERILEDQFNASDMDSQRHRLLSFFSACGDFQELAAEVLSFPNDPM